MVRVHDVLVLGFVLHVRYDDFMRLVLMGGGRVLRLRKLFKMLASVCLLSQFLIMVSFLFVCGTELRCCINRRSDPACSLVVTVLSSDCLICVVDAR